MFALCSSDCGYNMSSSFKVLLPQLPCQDVLFPEKPKQPPSILRCLCQIYVITATRTETKVEPYLFCQKYQKELSKMFSV